ncbi:hypothetical protein [Halorubrum vacuolatum]|uniref:Uncharacterized protein n=1 Tax=Halorubrum vacuolatum TaxID=63740 RepID=A0A238URI6_HALVU|nr:hypothetical protein [Halorubrum vacuolatum]SNR24760.1 hypothetical protein SAMN06264855_101296 [Halorubrum vacuolatum]
MADTKSGRAEQARNQERRRIERDVAEALERGDEPEPADDTPVECYRRNCRELAAFSVTERYQEETGKGAVEATARLCEIHTAEESPTNLDKAYADYVFRVEPLPDGNH